MLRFTCSERKTWSNIKNSQSIMTMIVMTTIVFKILLLLFMSLLTAPIVKNSHVLVGIYFIFLKRTPQAKLERLSIPKQGLKEKTGKVDNK